MTERYVQLTEDLQYAKRQAASYRQKCSQSEIEMQGLRQQIRELKKSIETLQQANNKLTLNNRQLNDDKESIMSEYSTQISNIKEEIASKQKQIAELRGVVAPAQIDQQIVIRQLKYDLHEEFSAQTAAKDKKIQEISAMLERNNYQREIERQKSKLKIQSLEDSLRQLQQRYEKQILQYSNRLFSQTQNRPNEDKDYLRRVKRQNQQLRKKIELSHIELNQVLQEKNQVTKDYTKWINEYKKHMSQHQTECQLYKNQIQRLTSLLQQQSNKKDDLLLKDRQREIKKLKHDLEELRDQIIFKEKKIADFQIQRLRLLNQIKISKAERQRVGDIVESQLKDERDKLVRELNETKSSLERLKVQNSELHDKIYDMSRLNVQNKKRWEQTIKNEEQEVRRLRKQKSQEVIPTIDKVVVDTPKHNEDAVAIQKTKVKEILAKYLQLKQRNAQLQKKLKQANDKIVELIQHKIILGSPKASNSKKIQFPTDASPSQNYQNKKSKQHLNNGPQIKQKRHVMISNQSIQKSPSPGKFHGQTVTNLKNQQRNTHAFTNTGYRQNFFSPQEDHRMIRIEDQDVNQCSYYEKSLKLKNGQKFKQLRCTNHEHQ